MVLITCKFGMLCTFVKLLLTGWSLSRLWFVSLFFICFLKICPLLNGLDPEESPTLEALFSSCEDGFSFLLSDAILAVLTCTWISFWSNYEGTFGMSFVFWFFCVWACLIWWSAWVLIVVLSCSCFWWGLDPLGSWSRLDRNDAFAYYWDWIRAPNFFCWAGCGYLVGFFAGAAITCSCLLWEAFVVFIWGCPPGPTKADWSWFWGAPLEFILMRLRAFTWFCEELASLLSSYWILDLLAVSSIFFDLFTFISFGPPYRLMRLVVWSSPTEA
jgi:hypothetical protein